MTLVPESDLFDLSGNLTSNEVSRLFRAASARQVSWPGQIDLARVERTDSSALALLLDWQARARSEGRALEFANPPPGLRVLAGLSQVDSLLGWESDSVDNDR